MKLTEKVDLGLIVLIGTLLISIPRFAAALTEAEPLLLGLNIAPVTGLGYGILFEIGIYFLIDSWFKAYRRKVKFSWVLLVGFGIQLALSPIIIAPAIIAHMLATPGDLAKVLAPELNVSWQLAGWTIIVSLAPALLLGTVAAANFLKEPSQQKPATVNDKASIELTASQLLRYSCQQCQQMFGSQPALNAHQKKHKVEEITIHAQNGNHKEEVIR